MSSASSSVAFFKEISMNAHILLIDMMGICRFEDIKTEPAAMFQRKHVGWL